MPTIAILLDGTQETRALAPLLDEAVALAACADVRIVPFRSPMSAAQRKKTRPPKGLKAACDERGLAIDWAPYSVAADLLIWHEPALLAEGPPLRTRMAASELVVVTHAPLETAEGEATYDIGHALDTIELQVLFGRMSVMGGRPGHKAYLTGWQAEARTEWHIDTAEWQPVFDPLVLPAHGTPSDRRGRISPPRLSAFPDRATLEALFPPHAESAQMLGAEWLETEATPAHWTLYGPRDITPSRLLSETDFFLHFLHPRAPLSIEPEMADAIAAGCLVITDPDRAAAFGPGVVGAATAEVDALIRTYLANPARFVADVETAQARLAKAYGPEAARDRWVRFLPQQAAA